MKFDPAKRLRILNEFSIAYARQDNYAEAVRDRALHGHGTTVLHTAVDCCLVGLFDVGAELIHKAHVFLRAAIELKEVPRQYGRGATESQRLDEFSLCNWFFDKRHDAASAQEAVRWREIWFDERGESDKTDVQLTLAHYLDAEQYDALFHRFEVAKLKPPKNLRQIKGQGTMSYVLARHRLGLEYSDEEVDAAVKTFLKRNVRSTWLDHGHLTTVALWMKIAFWKPGDDPIATLLKCYDFLPKFKRPEVPPVVSNPGSTSSKTSAIPFERDYSLTACWGPREETLEACAERLIHLFDQFAGCDASLASWYEPSDGENGAPPKPVDVKSYADLFELLKDNLYPGDPDRDCEGAEFRVNLRNSIDDDCAIDLKINCGSDSPRDVNQLVMNFPTGLAGLATAEQMGHVLAAVVRAWEPEWAGVHARERADQATLAADEPFLDWLLYLCRDRCRGGTTLRGPGDVRGLGGGRLGAIFITQPDPTDPANPQHQQNIDRARQAIGL